MKLFKNMRNKKTFIVTAVAFIVFACVPFSRLFINKSSGLKISLPLFRLYASERTSENIKNVLYINSYHPGYTWSDQVLTGIREVLVSKFGKNLDLRVEYLDAKRYPKQLRGKLGDLIAAQWKMKYKDLQPELIIVSDQDGYDLLMKYRKNTFPGVPLVFCGVEEPGVIGRNSTGILAGTDLRGNIKLLIKTMPDTERIWVITDQSATGRANRSHFELLMDEFKDKVSFVFFDRGEGLEPDDIISRAESLGPQEPVFFLDFYNTRSGEYINIENFLRRLCDRSAVPVFSHVDIYLNYGVTGGLMNSGYIQGKQAAETGLRILHGVRADDILPVAEKSLPAFNFDKLEQYKIKESVLPPESRVINRKAGFIFQYFRYFAGGAVLIILEGILIIWLFRLLRKQAQLRIEAEEKEKTIKQSEEKLKKLMHRYDLMVEASGQIVYEYIISTGGIIWGKSIETILGYPLKEIAGGFEQWKELLHPDDCTGIIRSLADAESACGFWDERYRMRHKEGHYVWIRDRGFFIPDDSGKAWCQIGMIEDITSLKRSEDARDFERRQLLSIFDSIDQVIYVSDPYTYEILFANRRLREQLGKNPIGKLCYRELQGLDVPCAFCTNSIILENGSIPYKWEFYNSLLNQTFDIVDRIIKWPDGRDVRFEIAIDITERKKAEESLRESEERLRAMLNALPDMLFVFNRQSVFIDFKALDNDSLLMSPEQFIGKSIFEILPRELAELTRKNIETVLATGEMCIYQYTLLLGGATHYYESRMVLKSSEEVLSIVRDITDNMRSEEERSRLQAQLVQAQKMESVGRLAGGIAHDFNNMLGAITGYSELALRKMNADDPLRRYIDEILKTAGRSADLTRQLLAFARQQVIEPKIVSLNDTVEGILSMLQRLIGENITLQWKPGDNMWPVNIDPAQMDQILANLIINARDAIKGAGMILIETGYRIVEEPGLYGTDRIQPGDYSILTVSDNGSGMDRETRERIFEPFFTTKELGHGTGLGLATVYGIVKQNEGFINVYSEPGKGSSFRIYFPAVKGESSREQAGDDEIIPAGSGEVVLLAEDEPALMEIAKSVLEELNYNVITAASPDEAISLCRAYEGEIDLLITDIIMPQMNGRELSAKIQSEREGLKILYMSGYTADVIARQGVIEEGISFIQKPFSIRDIALKIRSVLGKD